jgi:hypothetical protein
MTPGAVYTDREITAYHEAAHAVLARIVNVPVHSATVSPRPGDLGHVSLDHSAINAYANSLGADGEKCADYMQRVIMVLLAGAAAQRRLQPGGFHIPTGCGPDYKEAKRFARMIADNGKNARAMLTDFEKFNDKVMAGCWDNVEAVARALLTGESLSSRAVLDIMIQLDKSGTLALEAAP